MRRYALREDQWERIKDLLPGREGYVGVTEGQSAFCRGGAVPLPGGDTLARPAGAFWRPDQGSHASYALGQERGVGDAVQGFGGGRRQRIRDDRFDHRARPSAQCGRAQKNGGDEAIGRSRGGLSSKIHALVDALGNPVRFLLTPGQAHDLEGTDAFLPELRAGALLADRAYDADARVIVPLLAAGKTPVIPCVPGRTRPRPYDRELYKERHLVENFFCKLKQFRAIATRYDKRATNFLAGIYAAAILIWLN